MCMGSHTTECKEIITHEHCSLTGGKVVRGQLTDQTTYHGYQFDRRVIDTSTTKQPDNMSTKRLRSLSNTADNMSTKRLRSSSNTGQHVNEEVTKLIKHRTTCQRRLFDWRVTNWLLNNTNKLTAHQPTSPTNMSTNRLFDRRMLINQKARKNVKNRQFDRIG